jgi:energy-coupling factor transporter ATP-binding protein EcfA2
MDTAVTVRGSGISKSFGDVIALDRVDLNVARSQIHGLVGPNGAGKTTLLILPLGLAVVDDKVRGFSLGIAPAARTGRGAAHQASAPGAPFPGIPPASLSLVRPSTSSTSTRTGGPSPTAMDRRK